MSIDKILLLAVVPLLALMILLVWAAFLALRRTEVTLGLSFLGLRVNIDTTRDLTERKKAYP